MLLSHGEQDCRLCFDECDGRILIKSGWRLVNDPGYWGSIDPRVLVLGQSKGNTQVRALSRSSFDTVAFAGIRDRLALILESIGVPVAKDQFHKAFIDGENDLGFASLLRCSLSDPAGKTSGSPVTAGMSDAVVDHWIGNCAKRWLSELNPRLRLVVFLGLTPAYVKGVMRHLKAVHPKDFRQTSKVTASASGVTWVFVQHPSRISENHYQRWIDRNPHPKRDVVAASVASALSH